MYKKYLNEDIVIFKYMKKIFLVNENTKKWLIISDQIAEIYERYIRKQLNFEELKNLINEDDFFSLQKKGFIQNQDLTIVGSKNDEQYLFIIHCTNNCNMKCTYCYINKSIDNGMSEDIIISIIHKIEEKIIDQKIKKITINFHGGEPMLFFDKIMKIIIEVEKINKKNENSTKIFYRIQTNGTIMSNFILERVYAILYKV
ncbi:MAG: 4Fe-4S cluster-binding domain-containing protein [Fusobacterium necrophorum]|nr:4Fe-4S cluster-binding domain-containing protein [Fusobacterium necrophorum]